MDGYNPTGSTFLMQINSLGFSIRQWDGFTCWATIPTISGCGTLNLVGTGQVSPYTPRFIWQMTLPGLSLVQQIPQPKFTIIRQENGEFLHHDAKK
jgi:hypothetical protein